MVWPVQDAKARFSELWMLVFAMVRKWLPGGEWKLPSWCPSRNGGGLRRLLALRSSNFC